MLIDLVNFRRVHVEEHAEEEDDDSSLPRRTPRLPLINRGSKDHTSSSSVADLAIPRVLFDCVTIGAQDGQDGFCRDQNRPSSTRRRSLLSLDVDPLLPPLSLSWREESGLQGGRGEGRGSRATSDRWLLPPLVRGGGEEG